MLSQAFHSPLSSSEMNFEMLLRRILYDWGGEMTKSLLEVISWIDQVMQVTSTERGPECVVFPIAKVCITDAL